MKFKLQNCVSKKCLSFLCTIAIHMHSILDLFQILFIGQSVKMFKDTKQGNAKASYDKGELYSTTTTSFSFAIPCSETFFHISEVDLIKRLFDMGYF